MRPIAWWGVNKCGVGVGELSDRGGKKPESLMRPIAWWVCMAAGDQLSG